MFRDLAIDLGSDTVSLLVRGERVVVSEPSVVARVVETGEVVAVGHDAARMVGRTPDPIETVRPLLAGSVVDFPAAQDLIRSVLRRVGVRRRHRVRAAVCVPSTMTRLEQQAVRDALRLAGVADVRLLGHTMAAGLGCRLPLEQPVGSLVVDIGAGSTEAAVLSLGGVVALESRPVGGFDLDREIQAMVERRHGLAIDLATAERAKRELAPDAGGSDPAAPRSMVVRGRLVGSGAGAEISLGADEVADAIEEPVRAIVDVVVACAGWTPPEIATDLITGGVHLVGGTAQLGGLAARVSEASRLRVQPVVDPTATVVRGAARCLGRFDSLTEVFLDPAPVGLAD